MRRLPIAVLLAVLSACEGGEEQTSSGPVIRMPIPDKTVVLTFDDAQRSHLEFAAPILERHGFGATFFVTAVWMKDKTSYLTWGIAQWTGAGLSWLAGAYAVAMYAVPAFILAGKGGPLTSADFYPFFTDPESARLSKDDFGAIGVVSAIVGGALTAAGVMLSIWGQDDLNTYRELRAQQQREIEAVRMGRER